jgi:CRISPR/Cas system CMR-associated protein Cmr3 (group 5 of RAMP superfamily)
VLTLAEATRIMSRAQEFILQADYIINNAEESSLGYGLAYDIKKRYAEVAKYKIYLLTDKVMSSNITKKSLESDIINGIEVA